MGDDFEVSKEEEDAYKAFVEEFNPNKICDWLASVPIEEFKNTIAGYVYEFREVSPPRRARQTRRGGARRQQAQRYETTDKIKARFCAAKANVNTCVADGSAVEIISDNWVKFGLLITYGLPITIQPSLVAYRRPVELHLDERMSVRPQQRFVIRQGKTIIGGGVFTQLLPPQTEEEKMKVMEAKMEKLKLDEKRENPAEEKEDLVARTQTMTRTTRLRKNRRITSNIKLFSNCIIVF